MAEKLPVLSRKHEASVGSRMHRRKAGALNFVDEPFWELIAP